MHTELALDAIDYTKKEDFKVVYSADKNVANNMVDCPYFKTNIIDLDTNYNQDISNRDSFSIYMCVSGEAIIENEFGNVSITKGETIILAAASKFLKINTDGVKLLEVTI